MGMTFELVPLTLILACGLSPMFLFFVLARRQENYEYIQYSTVHALKMILSLMGYAAVAIVGGGSQDAMPFLLKQSEKIKLEEYPMLEWLARSL